MKYFTCVSELIRIADTIELHYKDSMREMERSVCEGGACKRERGCTVHLRVYARDGEECECEGGGCKRERVYTAHLRKLESEVNIQYVELVERNEKERVQRGNKVSRNKGGV